MSRSTAFQPGSASQLRTILHAYLADDDSVSAEVDLAREYVWVAVNQADQTISPGLQVVRQSEAAAGLPMQRRICIQLDL